MDRFLIAGAALLLIFEVAFLVTDLDGSSSRSNAFTRAEKTIGRLAEKKNGVHRRGSDTLIWDESRVSDTFYEYDSILTLTNSSARLELSGDTHLDLDQDTLVVLEPSGETSDGRLKIRFTRGSMRARNASVPVVIGSDSFQLSTAPGADVKLAGLEDGRLHVEVSSGVATLVSGGETTTVSGGEKILLKEGVIEARERLDKTLSFDDGVAKRIYATRFPIATTLAWSGDASELKSIDPRRSFGSLAAADRKTASVKLDEGTTRFWLESEGRSSASVDIEARRKPELQLLAPLPRDRFTTGQEVVFAWDPAPFQAKYRLELSRDDSFSSIWKSIDVESGRTQMKFSEMASYYWRITAIDDVGIEAGTSRVFRFDVGPLNMGAPKLNAPEIREPAEEDPNRDGASFLYDLLIPKAHAQVRAVEAVLSWQPMEGAEFYVIEISKTSNFETPIVSKKLTSPRFVHRGPRGTQLFWRVAAGAGDQTGPFSAAAVVTLEGKGLKPDVAPEAPKTSVAAAVVATPTPEPVASPSPTPSQVGEAVSGVVPVTAASPTPVPDPAVSFAEKSNRKLGRFLFTPHYRQTESTNTTNIHGTFSGAVPLSFGGEAYLFDGESGRLELGLAYESVKWKPQSAPKQLDVEETRFEGRIGWRVRSTPWSFAVEAESFPLLIRIESELATFDPVSVYGVGVGFTETWLSGVADAHLSLRTGSLLTGGCLSLSYDHSLWGSRWTLGPNLKLEAYSGENQRKLTSVVGGLHLALGW